MVDELVRRGHDVAGVDIAYPTGYDIRDFCRTDDSYFDLVVHCAYMVGGRAAIDGTNMYLADNVSIDAAVIKWAVSHARQLIYYSSSAAYPTHLQSRECPCPADGYHGPSCLRESDLSFTESLRSPDSEYGWAKVTGERMARQARKLGLDIRILRPFSGYGSDQSLDYPFPSIIKRAREGDLSVWGPPGQTRDWVHVDDIIGASLAILETDVYTSNICTGVPTEMGDLMKLASDMSARGIPNLSRVKYLEDKPTGVFYRVGDPTVMKTFYEPKISIEEGVRLALET